ncbi:MAG: M50 family metallopeptidase [Armatimonas sp.]
METHSKLATRNILLAALATLAVSFIPYAGFVTYPLRILVTFIHEGSHALATVLTGGMVVGMGVSADGSGLTLSRGGLGMIISSAGYLGATLFGAVLLQLLRKGIDPRKLLLVTGVAVAIMGLLCVGGMMHLMQGSVFGLICAAILAPALLFGGLKLSREAAGFAAGLIGVQCVLNALFDLRTLFLLSATSGTHTDAQNMQSYTLIPAIVWATLWIVMALGILVGVLVVPSLRDAKKVRLRQAL